MPNFKPVWILAKGERGTNSQVFATRQEANDSAAARFMVWTAPTGYDVDETDDPVTYFRTSERGDVSYASLDLDQELDRSRLALLKGAN